MSRSLSIQLRRGQWEMMIQVLNVQSTLGQWENRLDCVAQVRVRQSPICYYSICSAHSVTGTLHQQLRIIDVVISDVSINSEDVDLLLIDATSQVQAALIIALTRITIVLQTERVLWKTLWSNCETLAQ